MLVLLLSFTIRYSLIGHPLKADFPLRGLLNYPGQLSYSFAKKFSRLCAPAVMYVEDKFDDL